MSSLELCVCGRFYCGKLFKDLLQISKHTHTNIQTHIHSKIALSRFYLPRM